jgi:hypothetical protein
MKIDPDRCIDGGDTDAILHTQPYHLHLPEPPPRGGAGGAGPYPPPLQYLSTHTYTHISICMSIAITRCHSGIVPMIDNNHPYR